jgi:hypothetical protein
MMKTLIPTLALLILNLADGAPITKSKGALAYFEWDEEGCENWSSMVDTTSIMNLWAAKVEKSRRPSISFYYSHWECNGDSATHTYVDSYDKKTSTTVVISNNLESGSVSSTFQAPISIDKYRIECDDCDPEYSSEETEVTLQATFVGTGDVYAGAEGPSRVSTVSIALTATNGTPMLVPSGVSGSIYYNGN